MTLQEAAKQAIDAINGLLTFNTTPNEYKNGRDARDALRAALVQPLAKDQIYKILDCERMRWATSPTIYNFEEEFARAIEAAHGIGDNKLRQDPAGFRPQAMLVCWPAC